MTFYLSKQPSEETTFGVDMTGFREIQEGEKITSHTVTCTQSGQAVSGIIVASSHTDTVARVRVRGGVNGKDYLLTLLVTTDAGHIREVDVVLQVRERP
jgi:hypothetical protein